MAEGAAEGATLVQQPGQLAAALAKVTEGRGKAREDIQRNGSSTSSRSSPSSSTDHSEVAVVAGKRCQEPWQEEHLGLKLSPSCCVC